MVSIILRAQSFLGRYYGQWWFFFYFYKMVFRSSVFYNFLNRLPKKKDKTESASSLLRCIFKITNNFSFKEGFSQCLPKQITQAIQSEEWKITLAQSASGWDEPCLKRNKLDPSREHRFSNTSGEKTRTANEGLADATHQEYLLR